MKMSEGVLTSLGSLPERDIRLEEPAVLGKGATCEANSWDYGGGIEDNTSVDVEDRNVRGIDADERRVPGDEAVFLELQAVG